jgi:hypothetical protein
MRSEGQERGNIYRREKEHLGGGGWVNEISDAVKGLSDSLVIFHHGPTAVRPSEIRMLETDTAFHHRGHPTSRSPQANKPSSAHKSPGPDLRLTHTRPCYVQKSTAGSSGERAEEERKRRREIKEKEGD